MSEPEKTPVNDRAILSQQFKGAAPEALGGKWDDLYVRSYTPWDRGSPNPALIDLLAEGAKYGISSGTATAGTRRKKALVPGCGKGYDVLLLSACGYDAYGLEISSTAIEVARKTEKELEGKGGEYAVREGVERGRVSFVSGDFFTDEFLKDVEGDGKFDLIYDYTFLCALPLSLRPAWSKRQVELLALEGRLVCLEFPTYKAISTGGPPWGLPPSTYTALLPRPGQEIPYDEEGNLVESKLSEPSQDGLKQLAHIKPKRTHPIGYDENGNITDWVGIWAHPLAKTT